MFSEFVDALKYQITDDAKLIVFTDCDNHAKILHESLSDLSTSACFLSLQNLNECSKIHQRPLCDMLDRVSFVVVWLPKAGASDQPMAVSNDMLERFFYFLSNIRSKELSGFTLQSNCEAFLDAFVSEKERRDRYLHTHMYSRRRIRTFPSLCLPGTSDSELVSYIHA